MSDLAPISSKESLDIQATIECGFTLKRIPDMIRYSHSLLPTMLSEHLFCYDWLKLSGQECLLLWYPPHWINLFFHPSQEDTIDLIQYFDVMLYAFPTYLLHFQRVFSKRSISDVWQSSAYASAFPPLTSLESTGW